MDAGSGTLARLQQYLPLQDLDAVVLSHSHPDHWTDVESLAVAYKYALGLSGLKMFAPAGLRELLRVGSAADVFDWADLDDDCRVSVGEVSLRFSRTDHPVATFAVRLDAVSRSLGYSADSGPKWSLASLGPGLDLALCEATFLSEKEGTLQHLSARQAGRTAAEAGATRLVITHLTPGVDRQAARLEAEREFGSPVEVASPGARYVV